MADVNTHARKHRNALPRAGLRQVLLCVPNLHHPDFAEEYRRQSHLAAQADMAYADPQRFMD